MDFLQRKVQRKIGWENSPILEAFRRKVEVKMREGKRRSINISYDKNGN